MPPTWEEAVEGFVVEEVVEEDVEVIAMDLVVSEEVVVVAEEEDSVVIFSDRNNKSLEKIEKKKKWKRMFCLFVFLNKVFIIQCVDSENPILIYVTPCS